MPRLISLLFIQDIMKYLLHLSLAVLLCCVANGVDAQNAELDSLDVTHYDLTLDMGRTVNKQLRGTATISFRLTQACDAVSFDLICDSIGSILLQHISGGAAITTGHSYNREDAKLQVALPSGSSVGDTFVVSVPYVTNGFLESYGWGGLHMDDNIYYNLGVAFQAYPHVYGRSWFPCRDNFYDKATYTIRAVSKPGWRCICGGMLQDEVVQEDGSLLSTWTIDSETPTYLVSVSAANWNVIERTYQGLTEEYPAIIGYTSFSRDAVNDAFNILEDVLPAYEQRFGPYRWGRIGYISTPLGSMEHVSNIGFVSACMAVTSVPCQMTLCHEFAHSWFGNLLTCASAEDMFINEGGASFCEEIANEAAYGKESSISYYQKMLSTVIRTAHVDDGGYRSLSGMPESVTYGTTTYKQGAMMWHSLRGYLGDSLFYDCMKRLFAAHAFGNIDAATLRDTLSHYAGIDLTGFFDFHVFNPGFVDYAIDDFSAEGNRVSITLKQILLAAPKYASANRVPVTFFGINGQRSEQLLVFDDSVYTQVFDLPFPAAFAVVDYHHALSDACTDDTANLSVKGLVDMPNSYCKINVGATTNQSDAWVHVGHHYVHPSGDTLNGIVRMANRYWQVAGIVPWEGNVVGRFLYNQGSNGSSDASFLDFGFFDKRSTLDSLALLYRSNPHQPWQVVSRTRTASSTVSTGYFTARLFPGEYTLAVIDSNLLSIPDMGENVHQPELKIYPNPSADNQFKVDLGQYDHPFSLTIFDVTGKQVLNMNQLHSGCSVRHQLPSGRYIVLIQNNFLSLQSQIVVK